MSLVFPLYVLSSSGYAPVAFVVIDKTKPSISMVDSTKVLCPLYDEIDIFIPGDGWSILPLLHKKCEILVR